MTDPDAIFTYISKRKLLYSPGETTDGKPTPKDYRIFTGTDEEIEIKWIKKQPDIRFKDAFLIASLWQRQDWVYWRPKPLGQDDTAVEWGNHSAVEINTWNKKRGPGTPEIGRGTKQAAAHIGSWVAFTLCQNVYFGNASDPTKLGILLNSNCGDPAKQVVPPK